MNTRVTEVADGIFQLATYLPDIDFGINQYLVVGDEPLLFHTGMRWMFPHVSDAVTRVTSSEQMRWIAFGHVESDECGSLNEWLALAPRATAVQSTTGCMVSVSDMADRPARALADCEVLDIGGHRMRWVDTPHVPHAWEAGLLYDESTSTLLCGDLFGQWGPYDAITAGDIVGPAVGGDDPSWSLAPATGATLRRLAALEIATLAPMHGPAYEGDCGRALRDLADVMDERITAA